MQDNMDRVWRRFGDTSRSPGENGTETGAWAAPLDIVRRDEDTVIRASMPGVKPEDIQVSIEDNVLTIKGSTATEHQESEGAYLMRERRSGSFHRALRLPESVDPDKVEPRYSNGVLTITIPKAEAKRARQLQVRFGDNAATEEALPTA